jgi:hypothetical protein
LVVRGRVIFSISDEGKSNVQSRPWVEEGQERKSNRGSWGTGGPPVSTSLLLSEILPDDKMTMRRSRHCGVEFEERTEKMIEESQTNKKRKRGSKLIEQKGE